jgi:hypothetical protein
MLDSHYLRVRGMRLESNHLIFTVSFYFAASNYLIFLMGQSAMPVVTHIV